MKYLKAAKKKPTANGGECVVEQSTAPIAFGMPVEPPTIVYIYDQIGPEIDYVEFCQALRYANEGQHFTIHINSPGGNLNSCLAIINAMAASAAHIVTIVDGEAASAAAMIWLAGHEKLIASQHTVVMLHGASTGLQGKTSDIANTNGTITRLVERLLDDLTEGFLTEDERTDIRKGVDVYLTGEDIIERLSLDQTEETIDTTTQE